MNTILATGVAMGLVLAKLVTGDSPDNRKWVLFNATDRVCWPVTEYAAQGHFPGMRTPDQYVGELVRLGVILLNQNRDGAGAHEIRAYELKFHDGVNRLFVFFGSPEECERFRKKRLSSL